MYAGLDRATAQERIEAAERLKDAAAPLADRLAVLDRYRIGFIGYCNGRLPSPLQTLVAQAPDRFRPVAEAGAVRLYEYLPPEA